MEIMRVNSNNIEEEHICCAITDSKKECGVLLKKEWLKERFKEGLVFEKLNARGKVFIEYIPAERAWSPIIADGYMFIDCFWVSGQYKGQGYANKLLDKCIEESKAQGKKGLVVLSSAKKMPFLSDPKYLKHKGFEVCDTAAPYFELLYLSFDEKADKPCFKEGAKQGRIDCGGFVLYYSNQCPHTEKYASILEGIAKEKGIEFTQVKYKTTEQAQEAPSPFTTYSLFYNGSFVTNEILSEKRFIEIMKEKGC